MGADEADRADEADEADEDAAARWEGKVPDVTLEDSARAYRDVVAELGLRPTDHEFDGRIMLHRATWPAGPFSGEAGETAVTCSIQGLKDGVRLSVGVEDGSPERLKQVLRALERRGVPVRDRGQPEGGTGA